MYGISLRLMGLWIRFRGSRRSRVPVCDGQEVATVWGATGVWRAYRRYGPHPGRFFCGDQAAAVFGFGPYGFPSSILSVIR